MERFANNLKESLMARKIKFRNVERTGDSLVSLDLSATETRSEFEKILSEQYPDLEVKSSEVVESRERVVLKVKDKRVDELRRAALEQSVETIRNRVDQFGVTEPEIVPQGDNRILIQLPGIKEPSTSSGKPLFWSSSSSMKRTAWNRP
jgi:preprotein translocase subunit SecD